MATRSLPTTATALRRRTALRAVIVAGVLLIAFGALPGAASPAEAVLRLATVGAGVGIVAICLVGWYLVRLAWLDGVARQFGHAWRQRAR